MYLSNSIISKVTFAIAALFLLTGCSSDEPVVINENQQETVSTTRTMDELKDYAAGAYANLKGVRSRASVHTAEPVKVGMNSSSRSDGNSDWDFYAVNIGDDEGYVIVTDNQAVEPVFAVIEEGTFEGIEPGTPLEYYMNLADNYVSTIASGFEPGQPGIENRQWKEEYTDTTINKVVEPQLKVWWGQGTKGLYTTYDIYNRYCPIISSPTNHCPTGCVPTALGMVLSFVEYPSLNITFGGRNETLILNWDELNTHKYYQPSCLSNDDEIHDQIAKILRQLGIICGTEYHDDHSSTRDTSIEPAMKALKLNYTPFNKFTTSLAILNKGTLLFLLAETMDLSEMEGISEGGHVFLADGLKYLSYDLLEDIYEILPIRNPLTGEYAKRFIETRLVETITRPYIHIVWGWDNLYVGYYNENILDTSKFIELDKGTWSNGHQYAASGIKYIKISK